MEYNKSVLLMWIGIALCVAIAGFVLSFTLGYWTYTVFGGLWCAIAGYFFAVYQGIDDDDNYKY